MKLFGLVVLLMSAQVSFASQGNGDHLKDKVLTPWEKLLESFIEPNSATEQELLTSDEEAYGDLSDENLGSLGGLFETQELDFGIFEGSGVELQNRRGHHNRRRYRRQPRRPRRPHYPPRRRRPRPPHYRTVTCYASDDYGYSYWGQARHPGVAQRIALNVCYNYSRYCYSRGCR